MVTYRIDISDVQTQTIEGNIFELDNGNFVASTSAPFEQYLSVDGGSTWVQKRADTHPNRRTLLNYIAANGSLYFGTSISGEAGYLIRSTDNGETWTKVLTVESSSVWGMDEDSVGNFYVGEYSAGLADENELYGYNIWKSSDDGDTWEKFYVAQQQSTPGALDGVRHSHAVFVDSNDNIITSWGEINSGDMGGRQYYLNSDGTLGKEIINTTPLRDNGWLTFVELDNGYVIAGGDFPPNRILRFPLGSNTGVEELMNLTDRFGSEYDSPIYKIVKGKHGVLYAGTSGEGGKTPIVLLSADDGVSWYGYPVAESATKISVNNNVANSRVYIGQGLSANAFSIPDYTKAEFKALYTSTTSINGTITFNT